MNRPEIIGHGGAGHFFPGNSRASLEKAIEIGVDRIEFDVHRSLDGHLLLVHDDKLKQADGTYRGVRGLTHAEITWLLPGLLTFDDAVELIGNRAKILIDVKAPGYESIVIAAIRRHQLGSDHGVSSTYANTLIAIRRAVPGIRIGLSTGHIATGIGHRTMRQAVSKSLQLTLVAVLATTARAIGANDVMVQHRACTVRLVETMHRHGIWVDCWTVDHPKQIERVIGMGVDAITSNRPDLVHDMLDRSGFGRQGA